MPVKRYSTGMYVRLAFAVAAHLDPEILLLDEVFAVGDRAFQEKCIARISEMTRSGRTVLFVSHDVSSVARLCDRAIVLNDGRLVFKGPVDDAIGHYLSSRTLGDGATADEEREGTGEARISAMKVVNAEGGSTIRADQPLSIRVGLDARRPFAPTDSGCSSGSTRHSAGSTSHSRRTTRSERPLDGVDFSEGATAICELEELPLKPGSYFVSVALERPGGELVDRVTKEALFAVVPTDYFGTGMIPGEPTRPGARAAPLEGRAGATAGIR